MASGSEKLQAAAMLAVLVLCAGAFGFATMRPRGPVAAAWTSFRSRRAQAQVLHQHAADLRAVGHWIGPRTARRVVYEFSDYECPFCRLADTIVAQWVDAQGDAAILYIDLPLQNLHPKAYDAARAADCAEAQGRYASMHHQLMSATAWQHDGSWMREAVAAGVRDTQTFRACMADQGPAERIKRGDELAKLLGVTSTPTFLGRRGSFRGAPRSQDDLSRLP